MNKIMGLVWLLVSLGLPLSSMAHMLDPATAWSGSGVAALAALWCMRRVWRMVKKVLTVSVLAIALGAGAYGWSVISKNSTTTSAMPGG